MMSITRVEQLQQAQRQVTFPCDVPLQEPSQKITLLKSLRLLPGKRLTALAKWQGRTVVAKLFFHPKRWRTYGERDAMGVRCLLQHEVATPSLLLAEPSSVSGLYIVILDYLEKAQPLAKAFQQSQTSSEKQALLAKLMQTTAHLHQQGLMQRDAHFNNFLVDAHHVYTLDGHDVVMKKQPLSLHMSLKNLAQLFVNVSPRLLESSLSFLLSTYGDVRQWHDPQQHLSQLQYLLQKIRMKQERQRQKKIMRDCTEFVAEKNFYQTLVCDRACYQADLAEILHDPEQFFCHPSAQILKEGHTATVIRVNIQGHDLVVKRYNIKSRWHAVRRMFKPSRARRSWRNAHRLQGLEIAVAPPIALVEKHKGLWPLPAYYICQYIPGLSLQETIDTSAEKNWQLLINVLKQLAAAQITHGDMKASNFLVTPQHVMLIDLDSMKKLNRQTRWRLHWKKDMHRLLKNWVQQPRVYQSLLHQLSQEHLL